jgi:hypothetical protein
VKARLLVWLRNALILAVLLVGIGVGYLLHRPPVKTWPISTCINLVHPSGLSGDPLDA